MTRDVLQELAARSRERVARSRRDPRSEAAVAVAAPVSGPSPQPLPMHLRGGGFGIVAEIKKASPSEGGLAGADEDVALRAERYLAAGASMLSVLTEPTRFGGSREDLRRVAATVSRSAAPVPILRKDFLVDPVQVREARVDGASVVLLIAEILDRVALAEMLAAARSEGLGCLLEVHGTDQLERVLDDLPTDASSRVMLGVNSRDLRTLGIDRQRFADAMRVLRDRGVAQAADRPLLVAESGMETAADVARAAALGFDCALVGTALMRAEDPGAAVRGLVAAGQEALCARS